MKHIIYIYTYISDAPVVHLRTWALVCVEMYSDVDVQDLFCTCSYMCSNRDISPTPVPAREIGVYWHLSSNHCTRKCIHKREITN